MRTIHGQHFSYYAPEEDKGGGGGAATGGDKATGGDQAVTVTAADARTFLKDYVTDPESLPKLTDDKAIGMYGKIKPIVDRGTADWAPDWRQKLAGDDPKALKQLERYASPKDVWSKTRSMEARMSSGELKSALPDKATAEQITAWRTENGIPETPDKYDLTLKDGSKISKEDKPIIDAFLKDLHGTNVNNAQASAVVDWYRTTQARLADERAQKDVDYAQKTSDELHGEWGKEYRLNMNKIDGLLATMPADVRDLFKYGRLSNSDPMLANAGVLRALNSWARTINPVSTLIPNSEGDISKAIDGEIKQIEANMAAPKGTKEYKAYWGDNKAQERLRELYDGRDRAKAAPATR